MVWAASMAFTTPSLWLRWWHGGGDRSVSPVAGDSPARDAYAPASQQLSPGRKRDSVPSHSRAR
jgi:hypothetical protein